MGLDLGGMSGCGIHLLDGGVVRKVSPKVEYNDRLRRQAKKQDLFSRMDLKGISVPRVIGTGESDGLFHFDMEYAPGLGMAAFLSSADFGSLKFVADTIFSYLRHIKSVSISRRADVQVLNKVDELRKKGTRIDLINRIASLVESKGMDIPTTMCHGDLTMANMLFQRNTVCLLDFLDSYLDTYLCDLAKLKQDMFYLWTPSAGGFLDARVAQSCGFLWRVLEEEFREDLGTREFAIIDTINLLRIEPYLRTEAQRKALESALRRAPIL